MAVNKLERRAAPMHTFGMIRDRMIDSVIESISPAKRRAINKPEFDDFFSLELAGSKRPKSALPGTVGPKNRPIASRGQAPRLVSSARRSCSESIARAVPEWRFSPREHRGDCIESAHVCMGLAAPRAQSLAPAS